MKRAITMVTISTTTFKLPVVRNWCPRLPAVDKCGVCNCFPIAGNSGYFRFFALAIFRDTLDHPLYD